MTVVAPVWQRLEGLALLLAAGVAYSVAGGDWRLFALLFFAPDLSFLAYGAGPRIGAAIYNAAHSLIGPLLLGAGGLIGAQPIVASLALTWLAHIGFDRMLAYGLKSPQGFGITHLGLIGKARRDP